MSAGHPGRAEVSILAHAGGKGFGPNSKHTPKRASSGQLPDVEASWQKLWQQHRDILGQHLLAEEPGTSSTFSQLLQTRHGYSPAAAEQFTMKLF